MKEQFVNDFPGLTSRLGESHLPELLASARYETVAANTRLVDDQAPLETLWLIADGICRVSVEAEGRKIRLGRIGKGQFIGEISMLTGLPASSTVETETEVRLVALPHAAFEDLRVDYPEAASALVRALVDILADRLRRSGELLQGAPPDELELRGSEAVRAGDEGRRKGWLRRALERLVGADEASEDAVERAAPTGGPGSGRSRGSEP